MNQTTSASNCQYLNNKNFKYTRKSSANETLIDETTSAPRAAYSNAQHVNANAANKSASTSYLLSKISSLASLTMPKAKLSTTPTTNLSTSSSVSSSSHGGTTSPLSSHPPTGLMTNLASKFFSRKSSHQQQQQQQQLDMLSSSSSNSIGSPNIVHPNDLDQQRMSAASSPLAFSIELSNADAATTTKPRLNKQLASASSSSSACSSSSSTSNLNATTTTPAAPTHHVTSSRRPFKKRSQSTHAHLEKKLWFFNESDGCWFTASPIQISEHEQASSKSALLKRKQFLSKLNKSVGVVSASNIQPANGCGASSKVKLNRIYVKYLTLIELKYLKQLCFNKLQKQFESLQLGKSASKSNLNSNSSTSMLANQGQPTNAASFVRIAIPKDDSMKTIKTKNISIRSKSVDFKFFDDIKENYFFKKNPKGRFNLFLCSEYIYLRYRQSLFI